ncbi:MAG TPA: hypothetical protein VGE09_11130 [Pseudoxanthomonas sp.]
MEAIISRADARAAGLSLYFTGQPCKRGHVASRFVRDAQCRECRSILNAAFHTRTRDHQLARMARNNAASRERIRATIRDRYYTHPESFARAHAKRRGSIASSGLDDFSVFVIAEAADACRRRAAMTGIEWHVDHMVPLSRGGAHAWHNVQVIPAWLNRWKRNRLVLTQPGEWVAHLPGSGP